MIISKKNCGEYGIFFDEKAEAYVYASTILKDYVQKSTGFTLKIGEETKYSIVIGACERSQKIMAEYDLSSLSNDGFYIAFKNGNIYIFGNNEASCVYGVYEFLERFLGVRFLNVDCDYVPKRAEIQIKEKDVKCIPLFPERTFYCPAGFYDDYKEFAHKLRFSGDFLHYDKRFGTVKRWFNDVPASPHNSVYYVPKEKYGETHPEFYCKSSFYEELCYSNGITDEGDLDCSMQESVALAVADSMESYVEKSATEKYFMFGKPDDRNALCHCKRCEKNRAKYGGESGLIIVFLNAVIKEVERRLIKKNVQSDFRIVTFAYQSTVNPPVDENNKPICAQVIPNNRLHIRYAPISAGYTYSCLDKRQKTDVSKQLMGWAALTHNLMLWDYMSNFGEHCWYMYNLHYLKENLRLYADNHFSYIFNQGAYNVRREWQAEMKAYIASKLYWNLDLSVEELRTEYVTLYYGPAKNTVFEFLNKMDAFFKEKVEGGFHLSLGNEESFIGHHNYPLGFLIELCDLFKNRLLDLEDSALTEEEKETYIFRLEMVMLTPLRMLLANKHDYVDFDYTDLEKEFYRIMKKANIEKLGETMPLYIEIGKDGSSDYKILTGKTPTKEETESVQYLQNYFKTKYGLDVPIVEDEWENLWPSAASRGICIGENSIVHEFFKEGLDLTDTKRWLQSFGRCLFILSGTDILSATKYFAENIVKYEDGKVFTHIVLDIEKTNE